MKLFNDILKEADPEGVRRYSIGRVLLFCCTLLFFGLLSLMVVIILFEWEIDLYDLEIVLNQLKFAFGTIALYVLGSKTTRYIGRPFKNSQRFGMDDEEII